MCLNLFRFTIRYRSFWNKRTDRPTEVTKGTRYARLWGPERLLQRGAKLHELGSQFGAAIVSSGIILKDKPPWTNPNYGV